MLLDGKHAMLSELQAKLDSANSQLAEALLAGQASRQSAEAAADVLSKQLQELKGLYDDALSANSRLQVSQ